VLSKKIGIDLGTSSVTVYVKGEGIVLREPPADDRAGPTLQRVIGRVIGRQRIFRPDVMLSVPGAVTGVERRAVLEATMQAGAKSAYLIEKPLAAAIGAGIAIASTDGIAVCDLGASGAEAAVIVQGEMVTFAVIRAGGERLDQAIVQAVAARHGVAIDRREGERLKLELGRALAPERGRARVAQAKAAGGGEVSIDAAEVHAALAPLLEELVRGLEEVIGLAPPAVAPALARNGLGWFGPGGNPDQQIQAIFSSADLLRKPVYTFHAWPILWGTLLCTVGAVSLSFVAALFVSVFVVEFAPEWIRAVLAPVVRLLASVPSGIATRMPIRKSRGEP